jgi:CRP-like cAMP-binding protein
MDFRHIDPGEIIYHEGGAPDAVFVIRKGEVEVLREIGGELVRLGLLGQGGIFGESGVIRGEPRSTTTRALEPVKLIVVPKDTFLSTFQKDNPLMLPLLQMLCERLLEVNSRLIEQRLFNDGALRDEVARLRLLPDSPEMEVQIGDEGVVVAALPFRVGCQTAPGERASMADSELILRAAGARQISPLHFAIEEHKGRLLLRDLDSHLGTVVDGQRVAHFEQSDRADLRFGENSVIAGGVDSPFRFRIVVERAAE